MKVGRSKAVLILAVVAVLIVTLSACALQDYVSGKQNYPLEYEELISRYAYENDLDPYFVAAVIKVESGFDAQAVSGVGAIGLMQIMPDTGEWIAGKFDDVDHFEKDMLFKPEINIRFGCWYLNFLMQKFDGNDQLVMAGYNAGHNRVAGWLEDTNISSDGEMLTDIPFEETEKYVARVEKAYDKYKEFYDIT